MFDFNTRRFALMLAAVSAMPLMAQTTTPSTCTTAPQAPSAFNIESVFNPTATNNFLSTNTTPTISTTLQSAFTSGALEGRQQFSLNPATNVITIQQFGVAPGSPTPTLPGNIQFTNTISFLQLNVTNVLTSCRPTPSILYVGTIGGNNPRTPFGDVTGTPAAVSVGYTTDNPPKINNVVLVYAGIATQFAPAAQGTITFPAGTTTPPGSTANNPIVVFTPGAAQAVATRTVALDASRSTSPANLALTYSWRQVSGNPAAVSNGLTAMPIITLPGIRQDYVFEVTVTDTQGRSTTGLTTLTYTGS